MSLRSVAVLIILLGLLAAFSPELHAQCSMCNAVVSSGAEQGDGSAGRGINRGILFLMAFPYLLAAGFIYVFFGNRIRGFIQRFRR